MSDDLRVQRLLDELLDSGATPEEVCGSCAELLPVVRDRWRQMCHVQSEIDALFPPAPAPGRSLPALPSHDPSALPAVPGYEVEGVLGRGGMGMVFRARHLGLNRPVALKMVLAGAFAGPGERACLRREAETVAALRHPHIVPVYDVGEADDRPYFTMELVDGGSLAQRLTGAPLPAKQAAALMTPIADAVEAAHRAGVVHRDLKPANVLLAADGAPKVADFSLAHRLEGPTLTRSGAAVGTPSYMSPEQAGGRSREVGPAADVYALGAILYELLTGRPPFRGETAAETLLQVMSQDPVPPSRLNGKTPRDLETICLKCLNKEARLRYASAAALAEDLRRFLRGDAIAARPERRFQRLARQVRRRPALSAAVAVAAVLAVALVGGGLWLISDRTAAGRAADADLAAAERAADADLRDMARRLKQCSWPEASAALERAKARVGNRGSTDLTRRQDQGARDLDLAARLEKIRMNDYSRVGEFLDFTPADKEYEEAFRQAGFGQVHDNPDAVAARVKASQIGSALVAALDHWATCTKEPLRQGWLLKVAALADADATPWSVRARDPDILRDDAAFAELLDAAPVADQSAALLLALAQQWMARGKDPVPFLKRVQRAHPSDFWINVGLGYLLTVKNNHAEAIRYYQAALALRPEMGIAHNNLGIELIRNGQIAEAVEQFRLASELEPTNAMIHYNLALYLPALGRYDEAIQQIQLAMPAYPKAAILHTDLGLCLEKKGLPAEALAQHRQAVTLEPIRTEAQRELRNFLMRQGRMDEARAAWQAALEAKPVEHDAWYGYAELCLFLGREEEYRQARRDLLAAFGEAADPYVAERTGRASLLLPATGDELNQAVALTERAAAATQAKYAAVYPSFLFAQGLAEYRQGRFDRAISAMQGDASRVLGPAPRLVLAMALHRSGQTAEARKTLAAAVLSYDWRADQARDQDGWICHVLRREAEDMILPDLPALLDRMRANSAPEAASGTGLPAQSGFLQGIRKRRGQDTY